MISVYMYTEMQISNAWYLCFNWDVLYLVYQDSGEFFHLDHFWVVAYTANFCLFYLMVMLKTILYLN